MKKCPKCGKQKAYTEYWKNKSMRDGYQSWCKACFSVVVSKQLNNDTTRAKYLRMRRNNHLRHKYGITADEYDKMFIDQGGKCAICSKTEERIALAVDHDKETGLIRGILCENCNRGIGMFKHDIKLLNFAIVYMKDYHVKFGKSYE